MHEIVINIFNGRSYEPRLPRGKEHRIYRLAGDGTSV